MNDPVAAANKDQSGGGGYRNSNNRLETGGYTEGDEATSVTGEIMAGMGREAADIGGTSHQASNGEMNAATMTELMGG